MHSQVSEMKIIDREEREREGRKPSAVYFSFNLFSISLLI